MSKRQPFTRQDIRKEIGDNNEVEPWKGKIPFSNWLMGSKDNNGRWRIDDAKRRREEVVKGMNHHTTAHQQPPSFYVQSPNGHQQPPQPQVYYMHSPIGQQQQQQQPIYYMQQQNMQQQAPQQQQQPMYCIQSPNMQQPSNVQQSPIYYMPALSQPGKVIYYANPAPSGVIQPIFQSPNVAYAAPAAPIPIAPKRQVLAAKQAKMSVTRAQNARNRLGDCIKANTVNLAPPKGSKSVTVPKDSAKKPQLAEQKRVQSSDYDSDDDLKDTIGSYVPPISKRQRSMLLQTNQVFKAMVVYDMDGTVAVERICKRLSQQSLFGKDRADYIANLTKAEVIGIFGGRKRIEQLKRHFTEIGQISGMLAKDYELGVILSSRLELEHIFRLFAAIGIDVIKHFHYISHIESNNKKDAMIRQLAKYFQTDMASILYVDDDPRIGQYVKCCHLFITKKRTGMDCKEMKQIMNQAVDKCIISTRDYAQVGCDDALQLQPAIDNLNLHQKPIIDRSAILCKWYFCISAQTYSAESLNSPMKNDLLADTI